MKKKKFLTRENVRTYSKKALLILICLIMVTTTVYEGIPVAYAASTSGASSILGTNESLGSPILNNNFTIDNWNKWEMICWGIFLSNFCVPFVDTYDTAFKTGGGGSDGAGYNALCFGSGNDAVNNDTIKAYCNYAITNQTANLQPIYVVYSTMENGIITDDQSSGASLSSDEARQATVPDLFFKSKKTETSCLYLADGDIFSKARQGSLDVGDYSDFTGKVNGKIPTFFVKKGASYVKIFDYTNTWDAQMSSLVFNSTLEKQDSSDAFAKSFKDAIKNKTAIGLDTFGNIVESDGTMIIPAAVNQHLTTEDESSPRINLLNSFVLNGYTKSYSEQSLVRNTRQLLEVSDPFSKILDKYSFANISKYSGTVAINQSKLAAGTTIMFFDTDATVGALLRDNNFEALDSSKYNYSKVLKDTFDCGIENSNNNYPLKIEAASGSYTNSSTTILKELFNGDTKFGYFPSQQALATTFLADALPFKATKAEYLSKMIEPNGSTMDLFTSNAVAIPVQMKVDTKQDSTKESQRREFINYVYQKYKGNIQESATESAPSQEEVKRMFDSTSGTDLFKSFSLLDNAFAIYQPDFSSEKNKKLNKAVDSNVADVNNTRVIVAYPPSDTLAAVAAVLQLRKNTAFSTYSAYIYMTYLDWYGVVKQQTTKNGVQEKSNFNPEIFDESSDVLSVDPSTIADTKSDEDMKNEVINMSYLMLSPEEGREYRKQVIYNTMTDWLYEQYDRIVYGGKSNTYSGTASKDNSGFLAIHTYAENFATSWFLDNYVDIAIWMLLACIILIILIGLLKGRKISWYFLSLVLVVNVILLVPASGDLVPYITSNMVNKMFASKMTYWGISEGVYNAKIEKDLAGATSVDTDDDNGDTLDSKEASNALYLIKNLSSLQVDRSLMVKQDISQKLQQPLSGIYSQIQTIASARWILPMVMQQFSASDTQDENNYLYIKYSNVCDDMSNMYWYFNPNNAAITSGKSKTATSDQNDIATKAEDNNFTYDTKKQVFVDADIDKDSKEAYASDINYKCYSYTQHGDPKEQTHLYEYLLPDTSRATIPAYTGDILGTKLANYKSVDTWLAYIKAAKSKYDFQSGSNSAWLTYSDAADTTRMDFTSNKYDRTDRSTVQTDSSYLKNTESPVYYFFDVVKDSLNQNRTLGYVIGQLQGQIKQGVSGNDLRYCFMYATKGNELNIDQTAADLDPNMTSDTLEATGLTRDVCDLQEMFTNYAQYMYEMQLIAGGFDTKSGVLVEAQTDSSGNPLKDLNGNILTEPLKISDQSPYYEGMNQAWMYRCNWATKLMENTMYTASTTVSDKDGNTYTIANPMMAQAYPDNRPMVFSEAQEEAEGLTDEDLSLAELKCVRTNKNVAKRWTLLLNYAGTDGITEEVLYRQMAIDATEEFNLQFSSNGVVDTTYQLYPQSLDLRYLSFDSIMKMLMLNVSKNTSYIYGNSMQNVLDNCDMISAVLLLFATALCAWLIPLVRDILMAMIFYLGFGSIIYALFSSPLYKAKIACGQVISNVLFIIYTLVYYAAFALMMKVTSYDEVLSTNRMSASAGSPVWVIIAVILFGAVYIVAMLKQIDFCFKHFRDMGFEVYATVATSARDRFADFASNLGSTLTSKDDNDSKSTNTNSISGTGIQDQTVNVNKQTNDTNGIILSSDSKIKIEQFDSDTQQNKLDSATYEDDTGSDAESDDAATTDQIDQAIEIGRQMGEEQE